MKAIGYSAFGAASNVLSVLDIPTPTPAEGEVLVRVTYSGVNPSDVKARSGSRPGVTKPAFPVIVPHSDGAGVIEAVGAGVDPSRVGNRVWIWNGQWQRAFGTCAEYIALPSVQAVNLPDNVSEQIGAVLGIPALTAVHTVLGAGPVAGKTVLVSGGAGMVGHLAVQIAKASGARVIATASAAKAELVIASGADSVLDYRAEDLTVQILAANDGELIDHAVEVEFGQNADMLADVMAPNSRIASYGSAQAMRPEIPFYPMMFKAITLEMALIYILTDAQRQLAIANLTSLLQQGAISPRIDPAYAFDDVAKAHEAVEGNTRDGAVLVKTG
ncbi:MAG: NADPH:quinone reductase [Paracoccaceae bacterium]|nr:NADPH:quinone reductase [Paracoccaceae bacterium]MDG1739305.1 NADPH:quinone reductase [Paracoccaceae bacterium]MDG2260576.1 NADPH:quinone reductase [Paracoccaceae bacterium]